MFDTGTLNGLGEQSIVGYFPVFIFQFFRGAGACGVELAIYKQFCFLTCACAASFNNNNNKSEYDKCWLKSLWSCKNQGSIRCKFVT